MIPNATSNLNVPASRRVRRISEDSSTYIAERQLSMRIQDPNPPPNLVGVAFVVLQDVFVVDSASHMLRLGRREGFGRRF